MSMMPFTETSNFSGVDFIEISSPKILLHLFLKTCLSTFKFQSQRSIKRWAILVSNHWNSQVQKKSVVRHIVRDFEL